MIVLCDSKHDEWRVYKLKGYRAQLRKQNVAAPYTTGY